MSLTSTSAYFECVRNAMHIARPVFVFVDGSELVSESRVPAVPLRQQTAKGTTRGVLVGTGVSRPRLKRCRAHHGSRSLRDLANVARWRFAEVGSLPGIFMSRVATTQVQSINNIVFFLTRAHFWNRVADHLCVVRRLDGGCSSEQLHPQHDPLLTRL